MPEWVQIDHEIKTADGRLEDGRTLWESAVKEVTRCGSHLAHLSLMPGISSCGTLRLLLWATPFELWPRISIAYGG